MDKVLNLMKVENTLAGIEIKGEENLRALLGCIEYTRAVRQELQQEQQKKEAEAPCEET